MELGHSNKFPVFTNESKSDRDYLSVQEKPKTEKLAKASSKAPNGKFFKTEKEKVVGVTCNLSILEPETGVLMQA